MKNLVLAIVLVMGAGLSVQARAASLCDDPLNFNLVCNKMKNLRSHIMMLESQRDLMQLNYDYVRHVSMSLSSTATELMNELPMDLESHRPALQFIAKRAVDVVNLAAAKDPQVFNTANTLRQNCTSCHTSTEPTSGVKWGEVFKMDWLKIVQKCDQPGRNPFICKNMYGLVTNYGYISTAYMNKIENNAMIASSAGELARIAGLLVDNKFLHDRMANIQEVRVRAQEVVALAGKNDPSALEKANEIVQTCMGCHAHGTAPTALRKPVSVWQ